MAKEKNNEYFKHDMNAKDDPKIMLMMAQLGLEAYGIYWVLIEYLRQQDGYRAPLILLDPLSRRYGSSREKFEAIVTKFDLFECDDKYFFSPSLVRRMAPLEETRSKMKALIELRWNKEHENTARITERNTARNTTVIQRREEKRRVKKSIVEKSKEENTSPLFAENANQILVKKWYEWVDFRKLLKKPYKTTTGAAAAYNKLLTLSDSNSETAIAIINQSMENEWLGFFPLKSINKPVTNLPGEDPVERDIRKIREARANRLAREAAINQKPLSNGN